jgi:ABC-type multidrug transport system ATPase subunit
VVENAIKVHNLTKRFGDLVAVDDISFTVRKGEIFGLIGPNGAGKSTTIKMLTGLTRPTQGTMHILDYDVQKEKHQVLKRIGVLPEGMQLYGDVTGRDLLYYFAQLCDIPKGAISQKVDELLEQTGLYDRADSKIGEYSTGMWQKLAIAQAFLDDPEIVFLDEPTQALDPRARHGVRQRICDLKQKGITVLVTSHLLNEGGPICDRVAVIDRGRILAVDTPLALARKVRGRIVIRIAVKNLKQQTMRTSSIQALDGVDEVVFDENTIFVHLNGDCQDISSTKQRVLQGLWQRGLEIEHFGEECMTLEDVFLYLTEDDKVG